jgi:hypothetical protein
VAQARLGTDKFCSKNLLIFSARHARRDEGALPKDLNIFAFPLEIYGRFI